MGVNNSKFGAAGMIMLPFSVTNDGLMELFVCTSINAGIRGLFKF